MKRAINVMISSTSREDFGHQEPRTPGPFRTGSVPLEVAVVLSPKQVMCRTYMRNPCLEMGEFQRRSPLPHEAIVK